MILPLNTKYELIIPSDLGTQTRGATLDEQTGSLTNDLAEDVSFLGENQNIDQVEETYVGGNPEVSHSGETQVPLSSIDFQDPGAPGTLSKIDFPRREAKFLACV